MYLAGFGNYHQSEALAGALPKTQNSPQLCPYGLYAEQLSGSAFTRPRAMNLHTWLYRTLPSVVHADYEPYPFNPCLTIAKQQPPNPLRWSPLEAPTKKIDFIDGLLPIASNQNAQVFIYQCNQSMKNRYFSNADGEMLLVPYIGELTLFTELGRLTISLGKIAVIPRGIKFTVELTTPLACGYLCENSASPFSLPQLGFMGANALANPRHFFYPQAAYEDYSTNVQLICKYQHQFWQAMSHHSPLNVVAWSGNYAPYCYDLTLFNTINSVSFDHPDPSIFTVLTSESDTPGLANLDFVIFPDRWIVTEHTFRPPYFHRNIMNELMGLIYGEYDAKKAGFLPGGISIHNCMVAHGPDTATYQAAVQEKLVPKQYQGTLAIMFESKHPWLVSEFALSHAARQLDYSECWQNLEKVFQQP